MLTINNVLSLPAVVLIDRMDIYVVY